MNETVEMSKLRGEISILKEELQRIKIVAEQEKNKADALSSAYDTMYMELKTTIKQRNELDGEITRLHESFRQRVETEREQNASKAPAHFERSSRIDAILAEREKTHGSFSVHANCTQVLEDSFYDFQDKSSFTAVMQEGLHMIFHKLGRIAAGSRVFQDHWDDIAGYATLVSRSLENREEE
jgi:predicted ribosome quality control (RQC) complex YloA/Tae2 family protein